MMDSRCRGPKPLGRRCERPRAFDPFALLRGMHRLPEIASPLQSATYKSLADMRNVAAARPILLNAVYMPAVMDVISRLQNGGGGLESRKWYRVFKAKCDDLAIDPADRGQSPLSLAQKL